MDISSHEDGFSEMQAVKRRFFALRNGIISDTLRKGGSPFKIIFGLNLPQLKEIAEYTGKDAGLAEALWTNTTTRESMLLAPMIYPEEKFTAEMAREWLEASPAAEVTDMLSHALLRRRPFASDLVYSITDDNTACPALIYGALRLMFNLLPTLDPEKARAVAMRFSDFDGDVAVKRLAMQLIDELDFLSGN